MVVASLGVSVELPILQSLIVKYLGVVDLEWKNR